MCKLLLPIPIITRNFANKLSLTHDMKHLIRIFICLLTLFSVDNSAQAIEAVYRITGYNASTGNFTLAASGQVPQHSFAYFENEYGATTGNRYNQIPRGKQASLVLEGWQGCTIRSITLSMCSNNKSGQVGLRIVDGDNTIYAERPSDFSSEAWAGEWVSKDLNVYVDITKTLEPQVLLTHECEITLQGGTAEGSVYVGTIAIDYDAPDDVALASPLGYIFEKLTAKSTLAVGDRLMIYRNGCAAADIDGIQTSHYLDALPLASTSDVNDPDVLLFTLGTTDESGLWTLTNQDGQKLSASGKQSLAWDEGADHWSIALGYDGATITPSNSDYGTLRFNAPAESYARFALYTSKSLPLPYLYRQTGQRSPVLSRSLTLENSSLTIPLSEAHLTLHPTMLPTTTTDQRIIWTSDAPEVATVNGGLVTLQGAGRATITATARDGGSAASIDLIITDDVSSIHAPKQGNGIFSQPRKLVKGHRIVIVNGEKSYDIEGKRCK